MDHTGNPCRHPERHHRLRPIYAGVSHAGTGLKSYRFISLFILLCNHIIDDLKLPPRISCEFIQIPMQLKEDG